MKNAVLLFNFFLMFLVSNSLNAKIVSTVETPYSALSLGSCFKRIYTKEHMADHPTQKLSAIYVSFANVKVTDDEGAAWEYINGKVTGVKTATETKYTNTASSHKETPDYGTRFGVDGDGGAFNIKKTSNGKSLLLNVDENYYFPLYKAKYGEDDSVSLEYDKAEDRTWKLEVADPSECKAVEYQLAEGEF